MASIWKQTKRQPLTATSPPSAMHTNASGITPKPTLLQRLRHRIERTALDARIRMKWHSDRKTLPLEDESWEIYSIIHYLFLRELGRFPNLVNCQDYNDKVQWLKLFDQQLDIVRCSDKIAVRDYVQERLGEGFTPKLYQTAATLDGIDFSKLPRSFVIKTNHDSGSVILVRDRSQLDMETARTRISESLKITYGWPNGEWAYSFVPPRVLVEEFIRPDQLKAPPDYKFHCVDGKVRWLQFIYDRGHGAKEVITDRKGVPMGLHLYEGMEHVTTFDPPPQLEALATIAEQLARGWKYIRVDLFLDGGRILVGELTFYPGMGCYRGAGQPAIGKLLDFDRSTYRSPVVPSLKRLTMANGTERGAPPPVSECLTGFYGAEAQIS
jgi:hypothetical protein